MHGQGTLTDANGTAYEGCWDHGKREGWITETTLSGEQRKSWWRRDKRINYENEAPLQRQRNSYESCLR